MEKVLWIERVEEILKEKGVELDLDNDGWDFMFDSGWCPEIAVFEMLR